jgi:hypothetical protein
MLIQRISIHEWSSAGSAEELRLQRLGKCQTGGTDRNSRKVLERLFANPAIVGKNEIESFAGEGGN